MLRDIIEVTTLDSFRLLLTFDDGERREVDIASVVTFEGVFEQLNEPEYFQQVRVVTDVGTIVWPNGADLCPDVLYEASVPVRVAS